MENDLVSCYVFPTLGNNVFLIGFPASYLVLKVRRKKNDSRKTENKRAIVLLSFLFEAPSSIRLTTKRSIIESIFVIKES